MNFFGIGGMELGLIILLGFIVLGPRQLTNIAKGLGRAISELRNATSQFTRLVEDDEDDKPKRPPDPPNLPSPPNPPGSPDSKDRR